MDLLQRLVGGLVALDWLQSLSRTQGFCAMFGVRVQLFRAAFGSLSP